MNHLNRSQISMQLLHIMFPSILNVVPSHTFCLVTSFKLMSTTVTLICILISYTVMAISIYIWQLHIPWSSLYRRSPSEQNQIAKDSIANHTPWYFPATVWDEKMLNTQDSWWSLWIPAMVTVWRNNCIKSIHTNIHHSISLCQNFQSTAGLASILWDELGTKATPGHSYYPTNSVCI